MPSSARPVSRPTRRCASRTPSRPRPPFVGRSCEMAPEQDGLGLDRTPAGVPDRAPAQHEGVPQLDPEHVLEWDDAHRSGRPVPVRVPRDEEPLCGDCPRARARRAPEAEGPSVRLVERRVQWVPEGFARTEHPRHQLGVVPGQIVGRGNRVDPAFTSAREPSPHRCSHSAAAGGAIVPGGRRGGSGGLHRLASRSWERSGCSTRRGSSRGRSCGPWPASPDGQLLAAPPPRPPF